MHVLHRTISLLESHHIGNERCLKSVSYAFLILIQLTNLCENVSSLVGCADSGRTSPTATIGAVSRFAQEHSESNDKLTTLTQQFQQVCALHLTTHVHVCLTA